MVIGEGVYFHCITMSNLGQIQTTSTYILIRGSTNSNKHIYQYSDKYKPEWTSWLLHFGQDYIRKRIEKSALTNDNHNILWLIASNYFLHKMYCQ